MKKKRLIAMLIAFMFIMSSSAQALAVVPEVVANVNKATAAVTETKKEATTTTEKATAEQTTKQTAGETSGGTASTTQGTKDKNNVLDSLGDINDKVQDDIADDNVNNALNPGTTQSHNIKFQLSNNDAAKILVSNKEIAATKIFPDVVNGSKFDFTVDLNAGFLIKEISVDGNAIQAGSSDRDKIPYTITVTKDSIVKIDFISAFNAEQKEENKTLSNTDPFDDASNGVVGADGSKARSAQVFNNVQKGKIIYISRNESLGSVTPGEEITYENQSIKGAEAIPAQGARFVKWVDAQGYQVGTDAKFVPSNGETTRYSAIFEKVESTNAQLTGINKVYDGKEAAVTITGLGANDKITKVTVTGADGKYQNGSNSMPIFKNVVANAKVVVDVEVGAQTKSLETTVNISKRPIRVTANNASKVYGTEDKADVYNGVTAEVQSGDRGLISGDDLKATVTRVSRGEESVGVYPYKLVPSIYNENYEMDRTGEVSKNYGQFTITKRPVNVTANDASKEVGEADPAGFNGITVEPANGERGLVRGYSQREDKVAATVSRANNAEEAGIYPGVLVPTIEENYSVGLHNYDVNLINGKFTITQKAIVEVPDAKVSVTGGEHEYDGTKKEFKIKLSQEAINAGYEINSNTVSYMLSGDRDWTDGFPKGVTTVGESKVGVRVRKDGYADLKSVADIASENEFTILKVVPRKIEIIANSTEFEYDGNSHSDNGYTVKYSGTSTTNTKPFPIDNGDGFSSVEISGSITTPVVGGVPNVVGNYVFTGNINPSNYAVTKTNGLLTIKEPADSQKQTITITGESKDVFYNGAEQSLNGISAKIGGADLANGVAISGITGETKGINAGRHQTVFTGNPVITQNGANITNLYKVDYAPGTLNIQKRNVEISTQGDAKEYDGTPLENPGNTATPYDEYGNGFLSNEVPTIINNGTITTVGEKDNTYNIEWGQINKDNYNITPAFGKLVVSERGNKFAITVTAKSGRKTYDGTKHTVSGFDVTGLDADLFTISAQATQTKTSAGEYSIDVNNVVIADKSGNNVTSQFNITPISGKLNIDKRNVTIKAGSKNKQYDGTPLTLSNEEAYTIENTGEGTGFVGTDGVASAAVSYNPITNPGKEQTTIDSYVLTGNTGEQNYNIIKANGELEITDRSENNRIEVTVTGVSNVLPYTGSNQTIQGYTVTGLPSTLSATNINGLSASASGINVGKYPVKVTGIESATVMDGEVNLTKQFKFNAVDGLLEITELSIPEGGKIDAAGGMFEYNGQPHSVTARMENLDGYTLEYSKDEGENKNWSTTAPSVTDVSEGMVTVYVRATKTGSATVTSSGPVTIKVTPKAVTITPNALSKIYGEADPATLTGNVEGLVKENDLEVAYARAVGENANNYPITATASANENYAVTVASNVNFIISPRPITVTANSASKVFGTDDDPAYGGVVVEAKGDGRGLAASDTEDALNATVTRNNMDVQGVGKYEGALEPAINNTNYQLTPVNGTFEITKASATGQIKADAINIVYDGQSHKPMATVDGQVTGYNISYSYDQTSWYSFDDFAGQVNVTSGEVPVYIKAEHSSYGELSGETSITITKRSVTFNGNTKEDVYDGSEKSVSGATPVTTTGNDGIVFGHNANTDALVIRGIDVGTYTTYENGADASSIVINDGAHQNATSNYTVNLESGSLKINQAGANQNQITVANKEVTYNGQDQTIDAATALASDSKIEYKIDGESWSETIPNFIDAGVYTIQVRATHKNYADSTGSATLTIKQRDVSYVVNNAKKVFGTEDPVGYNGGTAERATQGSNTGLVGNDSLDMYIIRPNVGVDEAVGLYNDALTASQSPNAVNNNYNVNVTPGDFEITIAPAPQGATVSVGNLEETYDGETKSLVGIVNGATGYTVEYSANGTDGWTTTEPTAKNVVDSRDVYVRAVKEGHSTITNGTPGKLTVKPKGVTITPNPASKKYGELDPNALTGEVEGVVTGESIGEIYKRATGENSEDVGLYPISVTYNNNPNYNVTPINNVNFEITQREITITSRSDSREYIEGTPLTAGYDITGDEFVNGHGVNVTVTGIVKGIGTANNTFTYELTGGANKKNYKINEQVGTLEVTSSQTQFNATITGKTSEVRYTGVEQNITGYDITGLTDGHTVVEGDYATEAKGTEVGTHNGAFTGTLVINNAAGENITKLYSVTQEPGKLVILGEVIYDSNGGNETIVDAAGYELNAEITLSGDKVTRDGAVLLGWSETQVADIITNKDEADAVILAQSGMKMGTESLKLYAVWGKDNNGPEGKPDETPDYLQYPVIYNANGGVGSVQDGNIYTPGTEAIVATNTFSYEGYNFVGWNTKADRDGKGYGAGDKIEMVEGGINLFAQWDSKGGGGTPTDPTTPPTDPTTPPTDPTTPPTTGPTDPTTPPTEPTTPPTTDPTGPTEPTTPPTDTTVAPVTPDVPVTPPATPAPAVATPTPAAPATPAAAAPELVTDVNLEQLEDGEVPLANNKLDDNHKCCILHFLLLLCALGVELLYTSNMKKRQARIFELRKQIAEEDLNDKSQK